MHSYKRWMAIGAVAAAMAVSGCRNENREPGINGTPSETGTGGSGSGSMMQGSGGSGKTHGGAARDAGMMMDAGTGTGGSGGLDTDRPASLGNQSIDNQPIDNGVGGSTGSGSDSQR